jgi:hypothetical protein
VTPAVVPGTVVWGALAAGVVVWLGVLALSAGRFVGPRRVMRWFLASWLSRAMVLAAWAAAGWHIFCQRP